MKTSPTQRSLAHLRKIGWTAAITEHWNPHAFIRQDLFGFADLLCLKAGEPHLIVQTTSGNNAAARVTKILAEPKARLWLETGGTIVVHGWAKRGARGKRKLWTLREEAITLTDFNRPAPVAPAVEPSPPPQTQCA